MLCTVNKDFICCQFVLAYRNGSDLNACLHIGQGRKTQTQVVTWGTFETNCDAVSQLKSGTTLSRHSQHLLYCMCFDLVKLSIFLFYFFVFYFIAYTQSSVQDIDWQTTSIEISLWFISMYLWTAAHLLKWISLNELVLIEFVEF